MAGIRHNEIAEDVQGTLWQGMEGSKAVSLAETGEKKRVCFRNLTDQTIVLCWVSETGIPHHFYALNPWRGRGSGLRGGRKVLKVSEEDHVETTTEGHAFLLAACEDVETVRKDKSLNAPGVSIIGAYRPEKILSDKDDASKVPKEDAALTVHLIEVVDRSKASNTRSLLDMLSCCRPKQKQLEDTDDEDSQTDHFILVARMAVLDNSPLDTTNKYYEKASIGKCKWPVMIEDKWYGDDPELQQILERDVDHLASCLPAHATELLRDVQPTPIWINRTMKYGPKACPVTAIDMCFHPGKEWLIRNGMHPEKSECVELYCSANYRKSRKFWGTGGLLLHEYSHAYHHKGCKDGYENREIIECYEQAMKEGLYDCVKVKGPQGPKARAYACTDAMEYFAELSTAFLGGVPNKEKERDGKRNGVDEYNKWYPFNRKQIKEHDPRAYDLLMKIWKIDGSGSK